jgi:ribonuclease E
MLINYMPGEECRIAIVSDRRLEEFYQERASSESHVGNIYKGRVTNIEPSIQAAFVDFGIGKNGFLHVTDLHPMYFSGGAKEQVENVGSKTPHRERPPIQKALRRGQEVLVQVLKEGIGNKGPTLTTYLSIPGRFLVMMPHMQRLGVSRKVEDEDTRRELRKVIEQLDPPKEFGFIVRTAGLGQTKTDLKRDLAYLQRLWKTIERRRKQLKGPGELYAESDLIIRTIRDVFSSDIERIVVDDLTAARRARDFLAIANPRAKSRVVYYDDPVPLFHRYEIEQQIESINSHTVPLPSGGSLVIDQTEALVAIDVNSGSSKEAQDAETNAHHTNLEAVDEICRQLKLRDLGGVIVNDLIDMRLRKHRQAIEQRFRKNLRNDRARTRTGRISQFGILEMTRQRMRPSLKSSIYMDCPNCGAPGHVKTPESVVLEIMRRLALVMHRDKVTRIELTISPDVAFHLLNRKRSHLVALENRYGKSAVVRVGSGSLDQVQIHAYDQLGNPMGSDLDITPNQMSPLTDTSYRDLDDPDLPEPEAEPEAGELETAAQAERAAEAEEAAAEADPRAASEPAEGDTERKRRPHHRGGRRGKKDRGGAGEAQPTSAEAEPGAASTTSESGEQKSEGGKRRRGRRRGGRRRRRRSDQEAAETEATGGAEPAANAGPAEAGHAETAPAESPELANLDRAEQVEAVDAGATEGGAGSPEPSEGPDMAGLAAADTHEPENEESGEAAEEAAEAASASPELEPSGIEQEEPAAPGGGEPAGAGFDLPADEAAAAPEPDHSKSKAGKKKSTKKKSNKKKTTGRKKTTSKQGGRESSQVDAGEKSSRSGGSKKRSTDRKRAGGPSRGGNEAERGSTGGYSNRIIGGSRREEAE